MVAQLRKRVSSEGSPFDNSNNFVLRRRKPTNEPITLGQLIDEHSTENHWILHPEIQRYDDTWSPDMKNKFMDSVFEGLATQTNFVISENTANNTQRIIEGAHRRRCILEYIGWFGEELMFAYHPENDPSKSYWWHDLSEKDKNMLRRCVFMKTTYYDLTEEEEILLFNRMNTSLPLQIGELINSRRDMPLCALAGDISNHSEVRAIMSKCRSGLPGGIARMADKAIMFQILYNFYIWCFIEKDPVEMLKNSGMLITESINPKKFEAACAVMTDQEWDTRICNEKFVDWARDHVQTLLESQYISSGHFRPAQLWLSQLMIFTQKFHKGMIYKINELVHRQSKEFNAAQKKKVRRLPAYIFAAIDSPTHPCSPKNLLPKLEFLINHKNLMEVS